MEQSHVGMHGKVILVIWHLKHNEQLSKSEKQVNPCVAPVIFSWWCDTGLFHWAFYIKSLHFLQQILIMLPISCQALYYIFLHIKFAWILNIHLKYECNVKVKVMLRFVCWDYHHMYHKEKDYQQQTKCYKTLLFPQLRLLFCLFVLL